jgi:hypothetical protein
MTDAGFRNLRNPSHNRHSGWCGSSQAVLRERIHTEIRVRKHKPTHVRRTFGESFKQGRPLARSKLLPPREIQTRQAAMKELCYLKSYVILIASMKSEIQPQMIFVLMHKYIVMLEYMKSFCIVISLSFGSPIMIHDIHDFI